MLVLSRRTGESIVIGNEVVVRVLDVRGDQIRIGIEAPRDVQIHREEVFLELQAENETVAGAAARTRDLVTKLPGPRPGTAGTPGQGPGRPLRPMPPANRGGRAAGD